MRAFVTGATGFIGRHLVPRLLEAGMEVTTLVRKGERAAAPAMPEGVSVVAGDLLDPHAFDAAKEADVVFHLAAISFVPATLKDPVTAFDVNARATLNLLEAARAAPRSPRIVFMSTGHVYGPAQYVPIDERHPFCPTSPYGASKAAADVLVGSYHGAYGIPTCVLRPFNIYGPDQDPSFVVPKIISQARGQDTLVLGDTSTVRDFTYIDDVVELVLLAATHPNAVGGTFNVGSGVGRSIREVIEAVATALGKRLEVREDPALFRPGELKRMVVDPTMARERLGWSAKVPLEEGIRRIIQND